MKKIWLLSFILTILLVPYVKADYSKEQISAYTWAFNNLITTQSTIDKANMNWEITRIELSKMISNYVINVLEKKLDNSKKCQFFDITAELDKQYDNWVTKACQLWLMGQWISEFRPYDKVTRAEFWTILSRALYGDKYNWWNPYYEKHLKQLNAVWIIKNISDAENRKEIRWYVMLMMKRSNENKNGSDPIIITKDNQYEKIESRWNTLYKNNVFWFQILLWEERKNWRILEKAMYEEDMEWKRDFKYIAFEMYQPNCEELYGNTCHFEIMNILIYDVSKYDEIKKQTEEWASKEGEDYIIKKNNKYVFLIEITNTPLIKSVFKNNHCYTWDVLEWYFKDWTPSYYKRPKCPNAVNDIFDWGIQLFDIDEAKNIAEWSVKVNSSYHWLDEIIHNFTWNLINWDDLYDSTQKKVYSVYTEITWNNTLYYNKDYDFFLSIWEKWKWWVMESAYEGALTSIRIRKDNNIYWIRFKEKEICRNVDCFVNDEKIWENEKYIFTVPKEFYKHRSGIILWLI